MFLDISNFKKDYLIHSNNTNVKFVFKWSKFPFYEEKDM